MLRRAAISSSDFEQLDKPVKSIVDLLKRWACERGACQAYILADDEAASLTFGQLDRRARAVAALLQSVGAGGEPVLLVYPPGLDYIVGFAGCLYAGAMAVPVPAPRLNRTSDRLRLIAADSGARIALTTRSLLARAESSLERPPKVNDLTWLATEDLDIGLAGEWREPDITGNTIAFLQYTSGSTTSPRGVRVTHGNLAHNESLIQQAFNQNEQSVILNWLPLFHDMGLIGGVLQPLYLGARCVLMSPFAFLQRPLRWLKAISEYRVTTSGGPDFAYALCARKAAEEDCSSLDLSSWTVAFNGSEPVRADTIDKFAETFAPYGFRRESFFPCYGLAEATLLVSGGASRPGPLIKTVVPEDLRKNRVIESGQAQSGQSLVASGRAAFDQRVAIVDPETSIVCPPDRIGEIWVAGPSVAAGYHNRPEESRETFQAYLSDTGEGPFLRTGDLGFIADGELFVTGRLKDLIIIRGQNYYPQDIEATVQRCSPSMRQGSGAAFSIEADGQERLVIVQEASRTDEPAGLIELVRENVAEEHQLPVYSVVLVKPGSILRTSSGKLRRKACRAAYLEHRLDALAEWREAASAVALAGAETNTQILDVKAAEQWLISVVAARLGIEAASIDPGRSITRYGLDSLAAIELIHSVETDLGVTIPLTDFLQSASFSELAVVIFEALVGPAPLQRIESSVREKRAEFGLSRGQQALYFLQQLEPDVPAYNLATLWFVRGDMEPALIRRAFQKLVGRHPALRTGFSLVSGTPVQRVSEQVELSFKEVDASAWFDEELELRILADANDRFDLSEDRLIRVILYKTSRGCLLSVVIHHIIADFWSLAVLLDELGGFYSAEKSDKSPGIPPPQAEYSDFVQWQEEMLSGDEGDRLWEYWREQLAGDLPKLCLPTDRPRPAMQTYAGDSQLFVVRAETVLALEQISRAYGATLFTTLAAVFQALLHRYTAQKEVMLGTLTNNRKQARFAGVVGYFVNPVILKGDFYDEPTFGACLSRTRTTVIDAIKHQDYPFALLVEKLQQARSASRTPLVEAMFIYQRGHLWEQEALARAAIGEAGIRLKVGELEIESRQLNQRVAQFDLTLKVAAGDGGIAGCFEYNTNLFDASTIARLLAHFEALLESAADQPETQVSDLAMMRRAERDQLTLELNDTRLIYPEEKRIHTLIEEQAGSIPEAVAVCFNGDQITYGELNGRANQLANHLVKLGVQPEARVGICMNRSAEMLIALLGILKSGGSYVPLDPAFPRDRLSLMIEGAEIYAIVTAPQLAQSLQLQELRLVCLSGAADPTNSESRTNPQVPVASENLAYVIYTSGSTGAPKGVMVSHRNVVNFFYAMNEYMGSRGSGRWLAVTSISFDISILELLWTLSQGFSVALHGEPDRSSIIPRVNQTDKKLDFSLFFFASDGREAAADRYRLLFEGAKFADANGFSAVWTPERHFHPFGGLFPNPSVTGAALAACTDRVKIRAGSVVLPLHNPIRVSEEWSVIDNISGGRVGISVASGWHADDFALAPENYENRRQLMLDYIERLRQLWQGKPVCLKGGAGNQVEVRIYPRPIQNELPLWLTAAGSVDTFRTAGEIGANLLTHLLGQSIDELAEKIAVYREAWHEAGHGPGKGYVTLMVHEFIGDDLDQVRATVKAPFCDYLKSSYGLIRNFARGIGEDIDSATFTQDDMNALLSRAFDRYFETSGLMGTLDTCLETVERMKAIGVDEVACLIDFGVDAELVLQNLRRLERLMRMANETWSTDQEDGSITAQITKHDITHLQLTPSMARLLSYEKGSFGALARLEKLLIGGEALSLNLARELAATVEGEIRNMYGPTETTIWSTTGALEKPVERVTIGRPIGNTEVYVLDRRYEPAPIGVAGSLHIGGAGVARGYLNAPELTAEKFLPNPFSGSSGSRIYATGDVSRYLGDGTIDYLGRADHQIKLRGYRIELEEIEAALERHPAVRQTAVTVRQDSHDEPYLAAYVVTEVDRTLSHAEMKEFLRGFLPEYMIPGALVTLDEMPLTPNGKVYRKGLPAPERLEGWHRPGFEAPRTAVEQALAGIWADVLDLEEVGIRDDFFEIGGHSILATRLVSRVRETLQIDLPLRVFLEAPTVAGLAESIGRDARQSAKAERIADLLITVAGYSDDQVSAMMDEGCLVAS